MSDCSEVSGDREVQRTMLELLNQLDGFSSDDRIKVCLLILVIYLFFCRYHQSMLVVFRQRVKVHVIFLNPMFWDWFFNSIASIYNNLNRENI